MASINFHDPSIELNELRNQLSYSKRIGFFLGAGTSKAVGISDIKSLTDAVETKLAGTAKKNFLKLKKELQEDDKTKSITVEDLLDKVRLVRQITNEKKSKSFGDIDGEMARELDFEICNKIYDVITEEERAADLSFAKQFVVWLNWSSRDFSKEIFTTNYDSVIERAMESLQIPFFDGFIGSNEPFFSAESLESTAVEDKLPASWIRLWKIHGSLGWFWKKSNGENSYRVVRLGVGAKRLDANNELVIYPSKEKYESSRKQPFISYFDRLRSFLLDGEGLFLCSGYSFSDEHINSVIFNCLKQNNRLHLIGFFFSDEVVEKLEKSGMNFLNFSGFGPKTSVFRGKFFQWKKEKPDDLLKTFWDDKKGELTLGDFRELVRFLVTSSGRRGKIEAEVKP